MTRGRGIKRTWGVRGSMSNKGGEGCQQLSNTSPKDISELSSPTSQQVRSNHCIISSCESNFQQIPHTSQDANPQQTTTPENVGDQQEAHTFLDVGHQNTPPQNVGAQQETPTQDVSPAQIPVSLESNNPQGRQDTAGQDTTGGMKSLKVNGDTFCPHEVVRDVVLAFKKSFSGPWHCWSKVPEHVRDKWFNDFENTFTNIIKEKVGETSTLRNEEGLEVDDGEEGGKTSEDDVNLLKTVPEEQLLKTWIETVGGTKKGKVYGVGSRICLLGDCLNANYASSGDQNLSNIPTKQVFETSEFQQFLDRVLDQRLTNMQEQIQESIQKNMEAEVNIAVRVVVARILGFTPQAPPDGSGSTPNIP